MNYSNYLPDHPRSPIDAMILAGSGPEPEFDPVLRTFLYECYSGVKESCRRGGLLELASLGLSAPWLYRLTFHTRGLIRTSDGAVSTIDKHVVALRFLPDYLRNADRFNMLRLVQPSGDLFHPNVSSDGAICVQIYPGESLVEICQSLHDLFRWRLRQYDERDALNPAACSYGRQQIDQPIDDRPLFGKRLQIHWQDATSEGAC